MTRANDELFDLLHLMTVETLMAEIKNYRASGDPVPPALLAQAIKLLKDNGIDSPARAQKVADTLAKHMPNFDDIDPVDMQPGHAH